MRFLVIGLGSMGKRRVRNLIALGQSGIAGFDRRDDRRAEAAERYGITTYASFEEALAEFRPDALVISTGPAHHMDYALPAARAGLHCFIEASVVDADRIAELAVIARARGLVMAPSCTMRYFPAIRIIKRLVDEGAIGRPLNLNYQTGQYLPDWHPWERVQDFYVSQRETGGGREIVPFELTWINDIFGEPRPLACVRAKISDIDADIDDIYHCLLRYPGEMLASVTVEVVSRPKATRALRLLGSDGTIVFDADEECVRHIRVGDEEWTRHPLTHGTVESGYINPEEPYISEMSDFTSAIERSDPSRFPNTLEADLRVLQLLRDLEHLSDATS
jgi:predicted dehydrogenase